MTPKPNVIAGHSKPAVMILPRRVLEERNSVARVEYADDSHGASLNSLNKVFFVHPVDSDTNKAITEGLNGECETRIRNLRPAGQEPIPTYEVDREFLRTLVLGKRGAGYRFDVYRIRDGNTLEKIEDPRDLFPEG